MSMEIPDEVSNELSPEALRQLIYEGYFQYIVISRLENLIKTQTTIQQNPMIDTTVMKLIAKDNRQWADIAKSVEFKILD